MKTKITLLVCLAFGYMINAQNISPKCGTSEIMEAFFEEHPNQEREWNDFNEISSSLETRGGSVCEPHYVIPVVFHVFNNGGAAEVTAAQIQSALDRTNDDFNGDNNDFSTVDPAFSNIRGTLNVTFVLAELDPSGNPTTGINYYPELAGFANGSGYDAQVSSYAWDNYKYMNVYIMNDLYNDGVTTNSGVAWYPDSWMSNNNLARIVYNHWYLGSSGSSIADSEFQSVFTHECGHWLNLIHTFENGCSNGDLVDDTPSTEGSAGCGPNAFSCGHITNGENYMDYNATCYKMFTAGQIARATTTLENHPTRFPLWQKDNLEATGTISHYQYNDPIANFVANAVTIQEGESILFTDLSCGFIDTWSWTIEGGDPLSSSAQNPSSIFDTPGVYTVSLVVNDDDSSVFSMEITVEAGMVNTEDELDIKKELEVQLLDDELYVNSDSFMIFDMMGRKVLSHESMDYAQVGFLSSGIYIVVDNSSNNLISKKIFID